MNKQDYIKPTKLAKILGISRQAIYRYIHKEESEWGYLPCKEKGDNYFIDRQEVLQWYREYSWNMRKVDIPENELKEKLFNEA